MADKDTGLIGGDTSNIKQTESNRVLTYAAVSDMIAVNNTYVCLTGEIVSNKSVGLTKIDGEFITGKTPTSAIIILSIVSDDYVSGGTFIGTLVDMQNNIPLCGTFFPQFGDEGVAASVQVSAANNYTKWFVNCENTWVTQCNYIFLELYLKYD